MYGLKLQVGRAVPVSSQIPWETVSILLDGKSKSLLNKKYCKTFYVNLNI